MILRIVQFCLVAGLSVAAPFKKGAYAPAPPGGRPACAVKSMTFCEEVDKYPSKLIQTLLRSKTFDPYDFFTDESDGLVEPPDFVLHQEMTPVPLPQGKRRKTRSVGSKLEGRKLSESCPVVNKTATPRLASNSKGEWRFIAQDEMTKIKQKFKVQLCNDSEDCQKSCTQFYSQVPMLAVDSSGDVSKDIFWLPSTCHCFEVSDNKL